MIKKDKRIIRKYFTILRRSRRSLYLFLTMVSCPFCQSPLKFVSLIPRSVVTTSCWSSVGNWGRTFLFQLFRVFVFYQEMAILNFFCHFWQCRVHSRWGWGSAQHEGCCWIFWQLRLWPIRRSRHVMAIWWSRWFHHYLQYIPCRDCFFWWC